MVVKHTILSGLKFSLRPPTSERIQPFRSVSNRRRVGSPEVDIVEPCPDEPCPIRNDLPDVCLDAGRRYECAPSQYTAAIPIRPIGLNTSLSFSGLSVSPRNKNSTAPLTVQVP